MRPRRKPRDPVGEAGNGPTTTARSRRRRLVCATLGGAVAVTLTVSLCVNAALDEPGPGGAPTKLARWGRCHGLGSVVSLVDNAHQGVTPALSCNAALLGIRENPFGPAVRPTPTPPPTGPPIPLHAPVRPLVSPAQPGEGVFTALVREKGQPVIQSAQVRPDSYDVGYPAGIVWMKQHALRFALHPGVSEPGGSWAVPSTITPSERTDLVAAYNGGFKVSNGDSHGGFYLDGRTVGYLRDGAASEVFHRDGSLTVGVWGQDAGMAPDVVGVRQCLVPLVRDGEITGAVYNGGAETWGFDDGGYPSVARSGVGVDRNGDIVYVGGRLLTVQSLATLLQRAGAVTAMMLDINLSWPSFISYDGTKDPRDPVPHNLVNFVRAPTRYYDYSARDFVAVYARP
ncbi:phosphodiester glycosidase family protein [Streptacidiphilus neutrinimicus]|uniref:phosphodiester glycosidase family protein n=1 Tax=Streptacidiphilus neutrinimicus TaxID=105420 RepID=UPI0005A68FD1|nr:phosphodiester glycosidase family protein [Streptacidiphilus neutrinimicus]